MYQCHNKPLLQYSAKEQAKRSGEPVAVAFENVRRKEDSYIIPLCQKKATLKQTETNLSWHRRHFLEPLKRNKKKLILLNSPCSNR